MQLAKRVLVKSTAVYDALLREGGRKTAMPPLESQLIAWLLPGAGQAEGNMQNPPLMGSLREKV